MPSASTAVSGVATYAINATLVAGPMERHAATGGNVASPSTSATFPRVLAEQRAVDSAPSTAQRQGTLQGHGTGDFGELEDAGPSRVSAAMSDSSASLPGTVRTDTSGLAGGEALLAQYPSLDQFPADIYGTIDYGSAAAIPGWSSVEPETSAYWAEKLGGNFTNVGNPDPARLLAQWLYHQDHGLQGTALTQRDFESGLAYALGYAQSANVTQQELGAALAKITEQGGIEGSSGYDLAKASQYFLAKAGLEDGRAAPENAAAYVASLRLKGTAVFPSAPVGSNITYAQVADALALNWGVVTQAGSPAAASVAPAVATTTVGGNLHAARLTTAPTAARHTAGSTASRIAALRRAIAHQKQLVAAQMAKGNGRTAARDQRVLDDYRRQLARLTA